MSVTVVGSIAYDAVRTPHGGRERMLGGAAVHFALAASFFDEVRVVGPVGDDFGADEYAVLHGRDVNTDDIEHVEGGKTFFWSGVYGENMNSRETLETDLNVFETFDPKLSEASKQSDVLFLANILPALQLNVRRQCEGAKFVALDSMDLWINIARDALIAAISEVDCVILNDSEVELFTGEREVVAGARKIMEHGPARWSSSSASTAPRSSRPTSRSGSRPSRSTSSPTRPAPATRSRAGSSAASRRTAARPRDVLRLAMAYGTAVASYNVEEFGTERVARLTGEEIVARVEELRRLTAFETPAVALR